MQLTIRDDMKVVRVLARDNEEVDDGWLCDKGRFGYQSFGSPERITTPLARIGGFLRETSWERALAEAASLLKRSGERTVARVGGQATNEEGFLVQHLLREGLGSPHVDLGGGPDRPASRARSRAWTCPRAVSDIDHADAILVLDTELVDEAPILDLRVRKAVRRNGARLVVASSRPSTLDGAASAALRFAPGAVGGGTRRSGRRARLARAPTPSAPRRTRDGTPARRRASSRGASAGGSGGRQRRRLRVPQRERARRRPRGRATFCATRVTLSSSGASGSSAASAARRPARRCSPSPTRSASPASRSPG